MNKEKIIERLQTAGRANIVSGGRLITLRLGLGAVFATLKEKGKQPSCEFVTLSANREQDIANAVRLAEAMLGK